jgi:uncharacterized membrane protein
LVRGAATRRPSLGTLVVSAAAAVFILSLVVSRMLPGPADASGVSAQSLPTGGDVVLDASDFDDGRARFFRYSTSRGREVLFFVMKSADGVLRAAFDACDVCYRERRGYHQSGDVMICNNCRKAFRSVDINVLEGGCNPAPIPRRVEQGRVVLSAADLESGAVYF